VNRIPRTLIIFYALVIYVFLQFCWWFYMLYDLNTELFYLREEVNFLKDNEGATAYTLPDGLVKKQFMILGEGFVFLILLALGMLQTRKSFRRETNAARQQKNFLLSVTHELKSPVASVKLFLETLRKRELPKEKQDELIQRAIEESNRLDQLIENILVAARIDNHAYSLHQEKLNLSVFTEEFIGKFNASGHPHKVIASVEKNLFVNGDRMALNSVLVNLVENATKYSKGHNEITLQLHKENNHAVLKVKDQGTGIGAEDKSRIFEKFFRAGNEETRHTKGTGLGLYIVKYLVSKHQGTISVHDNISDGGDPKGTTFDIRLKLFSNA